MWACDLCSAKGPVPRLMPSVAILKFLITFKQGAGIFLWHQVLQIMWLLLAGGLEVDHKREKSPGRL